MNTMNLAMSEIKEYFTEIVSTICMEKYGSTIVQEMNEALEQQEEQLKEILNKIISKEEKTKTKKTKKVKDPNAPKKRSAYLIFCAEKRAQVKADNPGIRNTEILQELGRMWRDLENTDPNLLAECHRLSEEEKSAYEEEMKTYEPSEVVKPKRKKSTKTKKPKAKLSKWTAYQKITRPIIKEENPDMTPKEVLTEIADRWRAFKVSLSDDNEEAKNVMREIERMVADDKIRYEQEMAEYSGSSENSNESTTEEFEEEKAPPNTRSRAKAKEVSESSGEGAGEEKPRKAKAKAKAKPRKAKAKAKANEVSESSDNE